MNFMNQRMKIGNNFGGQAYLPLANSQTIPDVVVSIATTIGYICAEALVRLQRPLQRGGLRKALALVHVATEASTYSSKQQ